MEQWEGAEEGATLGLYIATDHSHISYEVVKNWGESSLHGACAIWAEAGQARVVCVMCKEREREISETSAVWCVESLRVQL